MSGSSDRVLRVRRLVDPAVLLPWPSGSKGDRRKWKHLQLSDMNDASHLAKLESAGNIGVALGRVSNGLVTIDLDKDNYVTAFLAANPPLGDTLRTRGRRGCNVWLRCSADYPPSQELKDSCNTVIGEWRADGSQTIIAGTHPEGMLYQFIVEKPAVALVYGEIAWPQCIIAPHATESHRVRGVGENNRVRRVGEDNVVGGGVDGTCNSLIETLRAGDLIAQEAPTDYHQNNSSLFKIARLVRSCESAIGRLAKQEELEFVFDGWCLVSRRFWRHTRDDYWAEFLEAYHYARIGLHHDPVELALDRAKAGPLPELRGFNDERVRLLAAICCGMHHLVGDNSFFLPTRKLGQLLGTHWASVARWLVAFEPLGVLHLAPGEVRRRGGTRSPRYHYGLRDQCELCSGRSQTAPFPTPVRPVCVSDQVLATAALETATKKLFKQ